MSQFEEKALNSFNSGFNCSQSVLISFSEKLKFDKNFALSISCGFGSGMGKLQGTCGAVTGAFMVLGIYNSMKNIDNEERKEMTAIMIQDFNSRFLEKHNSTDCKSLLNCDLMTEEGELYMQINNLKKTVCEVCISDSIKIIIDFIHKYFNK